MAFPIINCPFVVCHSRVMLNQQRVSPDSSEIKRVIPMHTLVNDKVPGTHNCPASLMDWPLTIRQLNRLAGQILSFVNMMAEPMRDAAQVIIDDVLNESRGGHRGGRPATDLPANDPGWQLGGRADEDVPEQPLAGIEPRKPLGMNIQADLRGSTVSSNAEVIAGINGAQAKNSESIAVINSLLQDVTSRIGGIRFAVNEAISGIRAINAGAESERLNQMVSYMVSAIDSLEVTIATSSQNLRDARASLGAANEKGTDHIMAILS